MNVSIVCAAKFEVLPLIEAVKNLSLSCEVFEVGIGPIDAARSHQDLKRFCAGKDVLFVGSCGIFAEFTRPRLIRAELVHWLPTCVRHSVAELIEGVDEPKMLPQVPSWASSLKAATVICCPAISNSSQICPKVREELALPPGDQLVENLELYSCIEALSDAQSVTAILGVTNAVGPQGRKQWRENFKIVSQMTADFVYSSFVLKIKRQQERLTPRVEA